MSQMTNISGAALINACKSNEIMRRPVASLGQEKEYMGSVARISFLSLSTPHDMSEKDKKHVFIWIVFRQENSFSVWSLRNFLLSLPLLP